MSLLDLGSMALDFVTEQIRKRDREGYIQDYEGRRQTDRALDTLDSLQALQDQREYDSPSQQAKRLERAGINPLGLVKNVPSPTLRLAERSTLDYGQSNTFTPNPIETSFSNAERILPVLSQVPRFNEDARSTQKQQTEQVIDLENLGLDRQAIADKKKAQETAEEQKDEALEEIKKDKTLKGIYLGAQIIGAIIGPILKGASIYERAQSRKKKK